MIINSNLIKNLISSSMPSVHPILPIWYKLIFSPNLQYSACSLLKHLTQYWKSVSTPNLGRKYYWICISYWQSTSYAYSLEQYGYTSFMTGRGICLSITGRLSLCWSCSATSINPPNPRRDVGSSSTTLPGFFGSVLELFIMPLCILCSFHFQMSPLIF